MIKIAISGIGGVGGFYGGLLSLLAEKEPNELQVSFFSRGENMKKIQQDGLSIKTQSLGEFTTRPSITTDRAEEIGIVDYLICATKSYTLEQNIEQLKPCIGEQTMIIPLLNGADITDRIKSVVPQATVCYGCCYVIGRIVEPGHILEATNPREIVQFGTPAGKEEEQQRMLSIFHRAQINAFNPKNIVETIWRKYAFISIAAMCTSYYNSNYGDVRENHADVYAGMVDELIAGANAEGYTFPESMKDDTIATIHRYPKEATTSMHVDFMNHRPVELESLGGYTLRLGQKHKLDMPLHQMVISELRSRINAYSTYIKQ